MRGRRGTGLGIYEPGQVRTGFNAPRVSLPDVATAAPDAWESLGKAAFDAGLIINEAFARDYAREEAARVDDAVLDAQKRFELWKAEWNEKNRGKEGVNALKEYQDNFARIAEESLKEFGGSENEIFRGLLQRRLAERGLSALKEGAGFGALQRQEWLASQWQAQMADFQAYVAANPEDSQGIAFRKTGLMQSWQAKNPGLDPGGTGAQLNAMEFKSRMDGFLAAGRIREAKEYLAGFGGMAGLNTGSSLKEWLLAHNNPGSVTVDGTNFAAYATKKDGLKAIMGCLASYHKGGRRRMGEMIARYAPPKANDTAAYVRHVTHVTGIKAGDEVDVKDARVLAAMAGAIVQQEHSVKASEAELMEAAEEFLKTGRPKAIGVIAEKRAQRRHLPGFDPATFRQYEERIEREERGEQARADLEKAGAILAEVQKLPIEKRDLEILRLIQEMPREEAERMRPLLKRGVEERKQLDHLARTFQLREAFTSAMAKMPNASDTALEALAMEMFADVEDLRLREELKEFADMEIKNRRRKEAAREALQVEEFLQAQKGKSPAETQAALAASGLSPNARKRAAQLAWGLAKEETPLNMQATSLGLMLKDQGVLESDSDLQAFAAQNGLTLAQTKQIREYKGKGAHVSVSRINGLLRNLKAMDSSFAGPDQIDAAAYKALLGQLKPGQEASDLELMDLLSRLYLHNGGSFLGFFKTTVMDELVQDQFNMDWLPEVPSWQRGELEAELKAMGLKPSVSNQRRLLKHKLFEAQGWKADKMPEWER